MKFSPLLLLLLVITQVSLAANHKGATLKRLSIGDTGTAILWAVDGWGASSNNACSTGTGVLAFDSTTEVGKSMLSVALSAYMSGKKVGVSTSDTDCLSVGGKAPIVKRFDISN